VDRTEKPTRYLDNDQRVAVQTLVSGGVESDVRYYVFGNYIDEVLVSVIPAQAPNQDLYYAHDHLSSPVALLDDAGAVLERYERACPEHSRGNAYGTAMIIGIGPDGLWFTTDDVEHTASLYGNPYTFTGRELDTMDNNTLHLMYYRARTYDPAVGRFMQRDPLGVNPAVSKMPIDPIGQYYDSLSLYEYVSSKPLVELDPSGTKIEVIKKQHTNESSISGTRGMVTSMLSGNSKCKKKWFSCKAKLILDITGTIDLYLLQIGHPDWSDRYPPYHTKWGDGDRRSDLTERYATRSHELDHWYTSEAFWSNTKSSASPFDGKIYNDMATCQTAGLCIMSAVGNYWGLARAHSVSFDFNPLRQGGMYSTNPFVVTLSLSHCP
jgi:RHS repeat-associated protein